MTIPTRITSCKENFKSRDNDLQSPFVVLYKNNNFNQFINQQEKNLTSCHIINHCMNTNSRKSKRHLFQAKIRLKFVITSKTLKIYYRRLNAGSHYNTSSLTPVRRNIYTVCSKRSSSMRNVYPTKGK